MIWYQKNDFCFVIVIKLNDASCLAKTKKSFIDWEKNRYDLVDAYNELNWDEKIGKEFINICKVMKSQKLSEQMIKYAIFVRFYLINDSFYHVFAKLMMLPNLYSNCNDAIIF